MNAPCMRHRGGVRACLWSRLTGTLTGTLAPMPRSAEGHTVHVEALDGRDSGLGRMAGTSRLRFLGCERGAGGPAAESFSFLLVRDDTCSAAALLSRELP